MKLHDLHPAEGSRQPRTRVGRGIAAGKGKTAGRGTKGQKARAGGSIPPWFEGGQTPLHMRIPKLRGFKNRFKIEYEVVNIGAIGALADRGAFEFEDSKKSSKAGPITVNQDILRAVGLVRTLNKPLKILGAGDLSVPLFVVADAFTASARAKIEGAGGSVNVLEMPGKPLAALGVTPDDGATQSTARAKAKTSARRGARPDDADAGPAYADVSEARSEGKAAAPKASTGKPPRPPSSKRSLPPSPMPSGTRPSPRTSQSRPARRRPTSPTPPPSPTPTSRPRPRRQRTNPPATTPDPCSNRSSTPSARPTSGGGSCTSWAC